MVMDVDYRQTELEQLASDWAGRAIWLNEITFVTPGLDPLLLLVSSMEAVAVRDADHLTHDNIGRFSYPGWETVQQLKRGAAVCDYASRHSFFNQLERGGIARTQLSVQQNTRPVFEILRRLTSVQDPVFVLPFMDYELNFHDHNNLLAGIDRYLCPEIQAVVVGQHHLMGFRHLRNGMYVHCLTDGQYNALRANKIRRPKESELPKIIHDSCFVSYSGEDKSFAIRLSRDLEARGFRVWLAINDLRGGRKLDEQIEEAICRHDNFLVILSKNSMVNQWVRAEINWAKKKRRKFFPISLVPLNKIKWDDMMDYFVFDFSETYQFEVLLRGLK